MTDTKTTAKVTPRKGDSDTGKIKTLDLGTIIKWARSNPLVLAALVSGSGIGGQEIGQLLGQNVNGWWVAGGMAVLAAFDAVSRLLKRVDRVVDDIGEIKVSLARGAEKFEYLEGEVASLHDWRKETVAAQVAAAQSGRRRKGSEGSLKAQGA